VARTPTSRPASWPSGYEQKLDSILPNPPKITGGKVIVEAMPGVSA
jgi:hypothetical protein